MDLGLKGKVALVTAASKGLGKACALGFAREGASVAICSRDEAAVEATAAEIRRETGAQVLAVQADVTRAEEIREVVERTAAAFGRIDTIICNAGGPTAGTFEQITDEQWLAGVELNLLSVIRLIRAALPHLKASGSGRIVNLASSSVKQPIPALIISNTLRLGIQGLVKSCSDEFAPYGILVNTVAPGRFGTDRVRSLDIGRANRAGITLEEQVARTKREIALGRYGDPEEFARYVVFLGSPANTYVTGQALLVDGGMTRGL
jgi:3-oxoacyl-[acyl-carrier protein] reductase